ncbi:hypothetical protein AB9N12_10820 [Bacteroides sp. AN502(2024)]|uniref:hypothetical protein n=1 Tax=Bacteroides sp. AN502(2024) TaxID=3160599 RepID=UPI003515BA2D
MIFNSFQFLYLFPDIRRILRTVPYDWKTRTGSRQQYSVVADAVLYMQWNAYYTLVLFWVILVTFLGGYSWMTVAKLQES